MSGLAARRETEGPGVTGDAKAADRAFDALASAARRVEQLADSGGGHLLGAALSRLTDATAAAEDLSRLKLAVGLIYGVGMSARCDGCRLRLIR